MNAPSSSRRRTFPPLTALFLILAGLGFEPLPAANTTDDNRITGTLLTPAVPVGGPVTITWSIVPDGTPMPTFGATNPNPVSNLIARFDTLQNVPAGERDPDDLTNRPWFTAFKQMLNNFGRKSGITYVYVHDTDSTSGFTAGPAANRRGDVRIGGTSLSGLYGYNNPPSGGSDLVLNTSGTLFSDNIQLKIVAAHEHAHGLGLGHVIVDNAPILSVVSGGGGNINGPQFDDLLALHRKYGDKFEKDGGNDTPATAVDLGTLVQGVAAVVGTDANDLSISAGEEDFVSIDDDGDTDFFAATLPEPGWLNVVLTPCGPSYSYVPEGGTLQTLDATSQSNLLFKVYDSAGTLLFTRNATGIGGEEELLGAQVGAGTYKVEVKGLANRAQMYRLRVSYDLMPAGSGIVITSTGTTGTSSASLSMTVLIDGSGAASTASGVFSATGSVTESGAFGGTIGVTLNAMANVSTDLATLGDQITAGTFDRASTLLGVSGDPSGGGIGYQAGRREGITFSLNTSVGISPTVRVRIKQINVQNVGRDGTDPVGTESFTIVNLATRKSAEFVPASGTAGMFDVSDLDLSLPGGGSGAVAAIFSGDTGGFRVAGLMLEVVPYVPPANYSAWAIDNNIPYEPASGDFDHDGLSNLVEYALGLDPTSSSVPAGTFDGNLLSFTKGAEAYANGDVTYEIEQSTDLSEWIVVVPNNHLSPTISRTLPSGQPKEFARLKITQIP
jgi:hypothetical protein